MLLSHACRILGTGYTQRDAAKSRPQAHLPELLPRMACGLSVSNPLPFLPTHFRRRGGMGRREGKEEGRERRVWVLLAAMLLASGRIAIRSCTLAQLMAMSDYTYESRL